jgi:hypothetical protein
MLWTTTRLLRVRVFGLSYLAISVVLLVMGTLVLVHGQNVAIGLLILFAALFPLFIGVAHFFSWPKAPTG